MFETKHYRDYAIYHSRLINLDYHYTFYYDETNNIRKFYLKKNGFNENYHTNFVLGGLVSNESTIDLESLFHVLKLQSSTQEVKLKHIVKGKTDFLSCLQSSKLEKIFSFLTEQPVYLHFSSVNFLYFSLADIVDSLFKACKVGRMKVIDHDIKNKLYLIVKRDLQKFGSFLHQHKFPNINQKNVSAFCEEFISLLSGERQDPHINFLCCALEQVKSIKKLEMIANEGDHLLINGFVNLFWRNVYIFKNSTHIFDNEKVIEPLIEKAKLAYNGIRLENYKFIDSKDNRFIQFSDVLVGFIAKYFQFINDNDINLIANTILNLNDQQKKTLTLFETLVDKSQRHNHAFVCYMISKDERDKINLIRKMILYPETILIK